MNNSYAFVHELKLYSTPEWQFNKMLLSLEDRVRSDGIMLLKSPPRNETNFSAFIVTTRQLGRCFFVQQADNQNIHNRQETLEVREGIILTAQQEAQKSSDSLLKSQYRGAQV